MVFFGSGSRCPCFGHEPSSLFLHSVLVDFSIYDDAFAELVPRYANRALVVSCTGGCA